MPARLFLFDDPAARNWRPFTLTRPAGELLFGTETLRARAERAWGLPCEGHLGGDALLDFDEPGAPRGVTPEAIGSEGNRVLLCSRFACDTGGGTLDGPTLLAADTGEPVGIWVPDGTALPASVWHGEWPDWPRVELRGTLLGSVWDLMDRNGDRLHADGARCSDDGPPAHVHRIGGGSVSVGEGAVIEPGTVLDTRGGPVVVDANARVQAPCRIAGPAYVGRGSTVLGGFFENVGIGPACKVRGEVEATVFLGFANKAHDGFLGHSVVGRWVNLGAMTTNSDLKNTYGTVRVETDGRSIDTGLVKAGCLLGDHVRTGIGTLIDTGATVGPGASLFGGGMMPKEVPPFSWGGAGGLVDHDIDRFLETAARVMARRGVELNRRTRRLYRRAFADTAPLRSGAGGH
ncbi:MAG: hypothetical protein F4123_01460 [Gemmatimonadetes bacterium]|nr:hypothetical protein [Gemmatimonadota bacterium]MYC00012.1 hypothetical protein [Gemmatimonadota bacterium]MYI45056.1 hypothetical protein [Gemmatimonadota bacterium]